MRPRPPGRGGGGPPAAETRVAAGALLDDLRAAVLRTARAIPLELRGEPLVLPRVSMLAIIQHLTALEHGWFSRTFAGAIERPPRLRGGGPPGWSPSTEDRAGTVLVAYRVECGRSRAITAAAPPGAVSARAAPTGDHVSLEWILLHMIAETGRHAGQADVVRRLIDGSVGPPECGAPGPWP